MSQNHRHTGRVTLLSLLVLLSFPLVAPAERLPIKTYTTADGLAHNVTNKIVRDSHGFLWFCTNEGLSRFDGYSFRNFGTHQGLPHGVVNDLLETRDGVYWVATNGGVARFDPKAAATSQVVYLKGLTPGSAHMFTVAVPEDEDRRAKAVSVLFEDRNGTIWCGTHKGLYRLERTADRVTLQPIDIGIPKQYPEQSFISDLLEDGKGSLWIATPGGLYRRRTDGRSARYLKSDGLPDEYLQDLFMDHLGRIWVGSRYGGWFCLAAEDLDGPPRVDFVLNASNVSPTNWVFQLFQTSDRRFWAATAHGLIEFFPEAKPPEPRLRNYTEKNGLAYHDITALGEDLAGNLWLGSYAGAMKLARNGFVTYDIQDGLFAVNAIFGDRENGVCFRGYVVGDKRTSIFDGGKVDLMNLDQTTDWPRLGRFDGQHFSWFAPRVFRTDSWGWVGEGVTLQARNGEWWIAASDGLYRFPAVANFTEVARLRPLEVFTTKNGLPAERVFRLFEDSRERIWISTINDGGNGLAVWDRASGTLRNLAESAQLPSLKEDLARSFGEDRAGNVWLGFNTGLARYGNGNFTFFGARDGLPPGAIQFIYPDQSGRLWFASSRAGLIRLDNPAAEKPTFVGYTTDQNLSSDNAQVITEDLQGHIYVGTGRGLDRLEPATGAIEHFTTADGLAAGEFLAAFRDHQGALWFGTQKGMSRFAPGNDRVVTPPPILIAGLQVAGVPHVVSALGENEIDLPTLSADQNQLQIDFLALGFAPGDVLKYQYQLEGADPDWSAPTAQRTVNYARLAPGKYRFLVRALTSGGVFSSRAAVVSFTILPPVWQRWWFVLLTIVAIGLTVYMLFRYRVARILEVANIRTRIAADLHDDIGSNLTRIAILSEVAQSRLPEASADIDNPLSSIAEISRESVASMGDIVWAINPKRDTLLDLVQRMRRLVTELFSSRGIEFELRVPESQPDLKLGANVRRDLFLVFKEALNNVVRHSEARQVEIDLQVERTSIVLKVRDDGRGFDPDQMTEGHGVLSMKRRTAKVGGELTINSKSGQGTELVVKFPRRGL